MKRYINGRFNPKNPSKYIGNRSPLYRSSWEFAFMRFCDESPSISKWANEAIKIPYKHPFTGKFSVYVPDFFIAYTDKKGKSHAEVVEIKPENQTKKESLGESRANKIHYVINQAKWNSAIAWCKNKGFRFRVVNERDLFHTGRRG